MAVAFDAKSGDTFSSGTSTSSNTLHTVGAAGSNRALVVIIASAAASPNAVTGVHWDSTGTNQAASFITALTVGTLRVELWGLVAPTTGNKTLKVDWAASNNDNYVSAVSFTGVDQTGGATSFAHGTSGSGTNNAVSLSVTSATGNYVVGSLNTNLANILSTSGTNIFIDNGGGLSSSASMYASGAASVALTSSPNNTWVMAGVDVVAAGGGAAVEGNPHFIGRFRSQPLSSSLLLRQNPASDISGPLGTQPETNTHFIGKFRPPNITVLRDYRQNPALDIPAPILVDVPPAFIGKVRLAPPALLLALRQNQASDASSFVTQAETNTNAIGRFVPTVNRLLRLYRENQASDATLVASQSETNIHFIGKLLQTAITLLPWLRQNTANDFSTAAVQAETNTHFIGRLVQAIIALPISIRQNQANDLPVTAAPDNPANFIGRFPAPVIALFRPLRENPASDAAAQILQPDTSTYFVGRFVQTAIRLLPAVRQNAATDLGSAVAKLVTDWLVRERRRGRR